MIRVHKHTPCAMKISLILLCLSGAAPAAAGNVYKCSGGSGPPVYQQTPCPEAAKTVQVYTYTQAPPPTDEEIEYQQAASAQSERHAMAVERQAQLQEQANQRARSSRQRADAIESDRAAIMAGDWRSPAGLAARNARIDREPLVSPARDRRTAVAVPNVANHAFPPKSTVYLDRRGRQVQGATPIGPNAYKDRSGVHRTIEISPGVQKRVRTPIEAFNEAGAALQTN